MQESLLFAVAILLGLILLTLWAVLYQLIRQQGRMLLRLDHLEQYVPMPSPPARAGLEPGTAVAPFLVADLAGEKVSLEGFRGKRVLLVNWNPHCGYCEKIAPELAGLQAHFEEQGIQLLILSRGDAAPNRSLADKYGLTCPILLENAEAQVLDVFQGVGTPAAYLIDDLGKIARPLVVGADQVPALALEITGAKVGSEGGSDEDGSGGGVALTTRLQTYSTALRKWIAAGRPTRTDEAVQLILGICSACEFFQDGKCTQCGCHINNSPFGPSNKARMATEKCPLGKW